VLLVLLDGEFEPIEIYEADRLPIKTALDKAGSKARNKRGAMAVSKFKGYRMTCMEQNGNVGCMMVKQKPLAPPVFADRPRIPPFPPASSL
jgi:hypothetical protein